MNRVWEDLYSKIESAIDRLLSANADYAVALERLAEVINRLNSAQEQYALQLDEFTGEIMFSREFQEDKAIAKNAETRAAFLAMRVAQAKREGGELFALFDNVQALKAKKEAAEAEVEIKKKRVHALQAVVEAYSAAIRGVDAS